MASLKSLLAACCVVCDSLPQHYAFAITFVNNASTSLYGGLPGEDAKRERVYARASGHLRASTFAQMHTPAHARIKTKALCT
eukprot:6211446-Pleurochrysis_carterae.AAC.4